MLVRSTPYRLVVELSQFNLTTLCMIISVTYYSKLHSAKTIHIDYRMIPSKVIYVLRFPKDLFKLCQKKLKS